MPASGATFDENVDSPFEGGVGGCPVGYDPRHPPQPNGCCPPRGGIFRGGITER